MFIIFSLDSILLVLAVMTLLGIGWAAVILTWIWEHAVIVGIVLLILHIIINLGHTMIAAENYAGLGVICSVIHAVVQPLLVMKAYSISSYSAINFELFAFWFIVFGALLISENYWYKATEARNGLSVGSLLFNSFLSIGICVFLIWFFSVNH